MSVKKQLSPPNCQAIKTGQHHWNEHRNRACERQHRSQSLRTNDDRVRKVQPGTLRTILTGCSNSDGRLNQNISFSRRFAVPPRDAKRMTCTSCNARKF